MFGQITRSSHLLLSFVQLATASVMMLCGLISAPVIPNTVHSRALQAGVCATHVVSFGVWCNFCKQRGRSALPPCAVVCLLLLLHGSGIA
jgi:hypothetical protein